MFKILINILKSAIEQDKAQSRLNILVGKKKKSDCIKLKLPKEYIQIIELIAKYGIKNSDELLKIIQNSYFFELTEKNTCYESEINQFMKDSGLHTNKTNKNNTDPLLSDDKIREMHKTGSYIFKIFIEHIFGKEFFQLTKTK